MQRILTVVFILFHLASCATTPSSTSDKVVKILPNPVSADEKVTDENGEEVNITDADPEFFSRPSTDKSEYYRIIIKSDSYSLRQIRGNRNISRKADIGGDNLIAEELKKYDMIDFTDEGVLKVKINTKHGNIEELKFIHRAPRINNLAKIMQNDSTRWNLEFKDEEKKIPEINIYYQIILKNLSNRNEVKEKLKNEVVR